MANSKRPFGIVFGIVASALCAYAGVFLLLQKVNPDDGMSILFRALGFYFLGKAVYVGPHLVLTAKILTAHQNKSEK